ncbi:MAG: Peptidoglycan-binding protein [Candidatus Tokpelaia sp. JSC188]|nr:MAG: Peptidoglycan-binding protein [Candidatus Tokpelaia sp. JSC188]
MGFKKVKKENVFSRRVFLKAFFSIGLISALGNRTVANSSIDLSSTAARLSKWDDQFDVQVSNGIQVSSNYPILGQTSIHYTKTAIARYNDIVAEGDWPIVPIAQGRLQIGMEDPIVSILRQRLFIAGDLAYEAGMSQAFDTYVDAALRRFQSRHGLPLDGVLGDVTYRALNVSAQIRLNQLCINLERLNKIASITAKEHRFVMVNIPAAQIEVVENGVVVQRHVAIVGKIDRQTPILNSKIHEIILNPFWVIPKSIILKDIIPLMRKKPSYLTENNIHLFDKKGQKIFPQSVNWNTNEAVNLTFRQDPGKINAMSSTKINFYNTHSVYMHDTPLQEPFNNWMRFDSSGCIRVQNIRDLNLWILKNTPGWDRITMEAVIRSRKNKPIQVKDPVPLHFVYISAWSTNEGIIHFRDDIYHMDDSL